MYYKGGANGNPLFEKADLLAKSVYMVTNKFPKHELYGMTSQVRRAALSVILNLIEGYARISKNENKHFQSIAYGSLKETMYLIDFSKNQKYLSKEDHDLLSRYTEELSKILWTILYKNKI